MKPRTKIQREVTALSERLPEISDKQIAWAKVHCFKAVASICKGVAWCSECGNSWVSSKNYPMNTKWEGGDTVCCPCCGKKLKVEKSRRQILNEVSYMTVCKAVKGYQVLRHVYIGRTIRKGWDKVSYYAKEVAQQWYDEKGNLVVLARALNLNNTGWLFTTPLSVKRGDQYYGLAKYDIWGLVHPDMTFTALLRKYGMKYSFHGLDPSLLISSLLRGGNCVEMLFKTRQYDLIRYRQNGRFIKDKYLKSVNICNRNGYKVKDADMWIDYLDLLDYFGKDLRNAFYVCPKSLKKAHDVLMKRKERIMAEERKRMEMTRRIEKKQKMREAIAEFLKRMEPYMGLEFEADGIVVRPLQNLTQFYCEGKAMHHCVWTNKYYEHKDALILSARKNGERLETVEVNIKTGKVVQSRAACNGSSIYHDEIVKLVKSNMNQIRRIA